MFDIGVPELVLILVIALLVFGPSKMVDIGRELGKAVGDFRRATTDLGKEFNDALRVDEPPKPAPARRPLPIAEPEAAARAEKTPGESEPAGTPVCASVQESEGPPPPPAPATPGVRSA